MHSGTTFSGRENFTPRLLLTKRQALERIFHFRNFRSADAANDVASEIYDQWVWCNVCRLYRLIISKKLQSLVAAFSKLDRWLTKKCGKSFLEKEAEYLSDVDELFEVFCDNAEQRRRLEREYKLRVTNENYSFYDDQKGLRVAKCLDASLPLTSSDKQVIRRSEIKSNLSSSSACHSEIESESAADYVSESESTCTRCTGSSQSSTAAEFVVKSSNILVSSQNCRKWSNLARL